MPEERYGEALALAGISVQSSLVLGYALGGLLLCVVGTRGRHRDQRGVSFMVSAVVLLGLRHTPAAEPAAGAHHHVAARCGEGAAALFGDRMVRRAIVHRRLGRRARHRRRGPGRAVRRAQSGFGDGVLGLLAAAVPIGTLVGTAAISTGTRTTTPSCATRAWCARLTAALAAPLFWFEARGALAFLAFLVAGGMFAVSIPTNQVIGMRLRRDTRASAMGIAVGVLMGSQAVGAAVGGVAASVVGPPHAIAGALDGGGRLRPVGRRHHPHRGQAHAAPARDLGSCRPCRIEPVVDLVAIEAEQAELDRAARARSVSIG